MKISEVADAAGTTPRAVRHYHRLGLLPEPERRENGYRVYGLAELARLMRIRWLAGHGLPLGAVAEVLSEDRTRQGADDLRVDLGALYDGISRNIAELTVKKERLGRMLAAAERGRNPTALPPEVADALDRARERGDDTERAVLDRERDLLEVIAISGSAPDEMFTWFADALTDVAGRDDYRRMMRGWARLSGRSVRESAAEIEQVAGDLAALLRRTRMDTALAAAEATPVPANGLSMEALVPDPAQRQVVLRAAELLNIGDGARS